jgi:D-alanyl-lipoteichoic acid acyltransferase DltB (MBOAT superfamily)
MLFNSLSFLIFFPIVTFLYFSLPHRFRWAMLLAASCIFYMHFIPVYILILLFTILVDYVAGILLEQSNGFRRKLLLVMSLVANVGVLAIFKYFGFLAANLAGLAHLLGWNYPIQSLNIILPIGLSFHTFQAMSYTIEVYRGNQKAERHLGIYALYVMFYPQLVAGPIERPQNLLPQFHEAHQFDPQRMVEGLRLMLWGMFKKVVIADNLAEIVNRVYGSPHDFQGLAFLLATVFFSFQIYCDFSGYSDIARGAARVMGFTLMENFRTPYFSASISEFWRRWHISLSTWFRDYLYIPLGGNRVSHPRLALNLMIVFLISGLWHGANWTYVLWGGLHGVFLACSLATTNIRKNLLQRSGLGRMPRLHRAFQTSTVFALVTLSWVFFRANSVSDAFFICGSIFEGIWYTPQNMLGAMVSQRGLETGLSCLGRIAVGMGGLLIVLLVVLEAIQQRMGPILPVARYPVWVRWTLYEMAVLAVLYLGVQGTQQQFIYFQF